MPRERATYIKLRRFGYTVSTLSEAFGRSTSVVSRILKVAEKRGVVWRRDLRKIPSQLRTRIKNVQWRMLMSTLRMWESFMLGESDEPP